MRKASKISMLMENEIWQKISIEYIEFLLSCTIELLIVDLKNYHTSKRKISCLAKLMQNPTNCSERIYFMNHCKMFLANNVQLISLSLEKNIHINGLISKLTKIKI